MLVGQCLEMEPTPSLPPSPLNGGVAPSCTDLPTPTPCMTPKFYTTPNLPPTSAKVSPTNVLPVLNPDHIKFLTYEQLSFKKSEEK